MIRNLGDNAGRHARSVVRFSVRERDGISELTVADDGPGIPREQHARVFERFAPTRPSAIARDRGGSGLGFAIVHDIVEGHGGTITLDSAPGLGTRFIIELPRAD